MLHTFHMIKIVFLVNKTTLPNKKIKMELLILNSLLEYNIVDKLKMIKDKVMEFKNGLTEQHIWDNGNKINQMVLENLLTLMEIIMKAHGKITRQMEMEFIVEKMEDIIKVSGKMINLMDMVSNNGVMVIFIKEILIKAKNKAKELIAGQMDHNMMVIGIMEKYKVLENISIMMEEFFKDNGNKI